MTEQVKVTLTQIKQVLGISIALGTALVYGEVRIQLMENHKDTYEPIVQDTTKVTVDNTKAIAVLRSEINHLQSDKDSQLANSRLEW